MFNWFKKTASTKKACTELDVSAIQGDETITQLAISESEALKNQGNAHLGNGKLEEAAECFRRAIERNPRYAEAYATGTGMRAMDVFFTDPVMVPPQEKQYFTEEVRYLPSVVGSFFNDPFPDVNELPALTDGIITFASLNRLEKVSAEAYRVWAGILLAVPRSRLLLKAAELDDAETRKQVIGYFTKAGVSADRIIMQGRTPWHEHMQAYNQIDIAIDPFPHGGGVTALEGLMMGVPVINLRWPTVVGRVSASIMTTLGMTDWIAETQEEYVELAIKKASDLQSLATLRRRLRGIFTSSVIGDQVAYTRAVEQEYRKLWQEWCSSVEDSRDIARSN